MIHRAPSRAVIIASLVGAAGTPASALAMQAETPDDALVAAQPEVTQSQPAQPEASITFQFKDTPFSLVLDFFALETGLPIINEAPTPGGTMTFVGGTAYGFADALSILNLNLQMHGVHLIHEENYLYLRSIKDAVRMPTVVVSDEDLPPDVTPDMIVTMTIPLDNTRATQVAEQIKPLIGEYGGVTPVEAQNMLILVETAAQCQRITSVIRAIDAVRPVDSEYEVFKLTHSKAEDVVEALKGLIGQRLQQVFIDKDGRRTVAEEIDIAGLNLQPDPRTNSVIAVGPRARIDTVDQLIRVLDVPGDGITGERQMVTFQLETITPAQATQHLNSLFSSVAAESKPTVVPLEDVGKIAVIGSQMLVLQATALLGEVDPAAATGEPRNAQPETVARTIALEHITAAQVESITSRMLTARQAAVVRFAATPDGEGLLVSGPLADVESFEQLVSGLDRPASVKTDVRVVRVDAADVQSTIDQALALDSLTTEAADDPVTATVDPESRTVTLVGSSTAIARFERRINEVESRDVVQTVSRSYELASATPSELAIKLTRLAQPLLTPDNGLPFTPPAFEALDELDTLIVRAEADQFAVLEQLIGQLDADEPARRDFNVVQVSSGNPADVRDRALALMAQLDQGLDEDERGTVDVQVDAASGNLLVFGDSIGMQRFSAILAQVQQLLPPDRTTRVIDIQNIEAANILPSLQQLIESADSIDPARAIPDPTISVLERTNSLVITAESTQHTVIGDFITRLDKPDPTDLPPMRILQLRTADATNVAQILQERYNGRPLTERTTRPVEIQAEAQTNTLIVTAHEELFEDVKAHVEMLNREGATEPERTTKLFPLKVARAADVADAMDKLYPEPPMPADRYGRPMPWLQEKKEVTVSADPSSNSLIFDAPTDRIPDLEELAAQLDRVEIPPQAELRTFRVVTGDLTTITSTLSGLARQGALSAPAQPGRQAVQVMVEAEPRSSTLIVAGDDVTFAKVEEILQSLSAVPVERGLRIIPISNVAASDVRDRALNIYNVQIEGLPDAEPVEVSVNDDSNSLEIVGDAEGLDRFVAIIDQLQRQTGSAREVRLIELKLAKVNEVIQFLEELVAANKSITMQGGPTPVFEPIEATNSLMVAAQPGQMAIIEQLVQSVDASQVGERPPLRILRLRTTEATNLATVLQQSYAARPVEERTKKPVDIQADESTNTLIVSAHPDMLPEIEQIVTELNETQALNAEGREIRIFPLAWARAEELATTIDEMYPEPPMPYDSRGRPMPHLKQPKEVFVRADRATNSLIVDAPAQRLAGFEQIVKSLDQQNLASETEVRTYRVERAELDAVAAALRELSSTGALQPGVRTPVTISTEPTTRTLVVSGPTEVFPDIEKVLSSLSESPETPETSLKMYPLEFARAEQLQVLLSDLLATRLIAEEERAGRTVESIESLLDVAAHGPSNTLIVTAPTSIQQIAEELIASLDTEAAAAGRRTIQVRPLTFAEATEVAQTITQAIPGMDLPGGGDITVIPAAGSNAIILSGAAKDLERVGELIEPLDVRPVDPETMGVETFALEHADAATIATTVESLLVEQQETDPRILTYQLRYSRNPDLFQTPTIRVEAEPRTNSLIVSAPAGTLELAKMVIERLDQPAEVTGRTVATFTPAKANPESLVSTVSRIIAETLPQERLPLELTAEPGTGSVVAIGSQTQLAEAMKLLTEFDERAFQMPEIALEIVNLKHADAAAVATTVEALAVDRTRWPDSLRTAERSGLAIAEPRVTADADANRVVISAPGPLAPIVRELVSTLDQPSGREVSVRLFPLKQGSAESVAAALQSAFTAGARPGEPVASATAEPTSNTVVVSGSTERLAEAESFVLAMDETIEPNGMGVRTIVLEHARAGAVAPILEQLLTEESIADRLPDYALWGFLSRQRNSTEEAGPQVRVAAESRLNAVVIAAPMAVIELAEQLAGELDLPPEGGPAGSRIVRVIPLLNADATTLAESIDAMFEEDATNAAPPIVRVEPSGNALIVRATSEQMELIEGLATDLDAATLSGARQLRMIPVDRSRADAALMATTIQRLLEQQGGVKVEIISTEELLGEAGEGERGSDASPFRRNTLPEALSLPEFVAIACIGHPASQSQDEDDRPVVRIAVDPASNSLVVVGSPRLTDRIVELAAQLAEQMPVAPSGVRIVTLPDGADATAIYPIVNRTIQEIGAASAMNPGGFTGSVVVSPDPTGTALIVWANDTDFQSVGKLVASVASLDPTLELTVKVYPLEHLSASGATQAISDLFSVNPRGRQAQQMRGVDVTVTDSDGSTARGTIDPSLVRVTAPQGGTSVLVAAPAEAIEMIDSLIGLLDQSPVADRLAIRRYELVNADAEDLSQTLQSLFDAQRQGVARNEMPQAEFVPDDRTNALLVTASATQHEEVARLLVTADAPRGDDGLELAIIKLTQADAGAAERILDQIIIGNDPGKRERVQITGDEDTGVLIVRAEPDDIAEINRIVGEIDSAEFADLPIRSITLERADAQAVATALNAFFRDRQQALQRSGRRQQQGVAISGDRRSGTLVIAAGDADYEQIVALAERYDTDSSELAELKYEVITLENARVNDIEDTLRNLSSELQYERMYGSRSRGGSTSPEDKLLIDFNERLNAVIVLGQGETLAVMKNIIASLDVPFSEQTARIVRVIPIEDGDPETIADVVESAMDTGGGNDWWWPPRSDPDEITVEVDARRRAIILIGPGARVEQAAAYVEQLDTVTGRPNTVVTSIPLRFADASRASQDLSLFFRQRSRASGLPADAVSIIGSRDGNLLLVTADEESLALVRDLVNEIDRPEMGDDRKIEIVYLQNGTADEVAEAVRTLFPSTGRSDERVIVTPQTGNNSLIVSAPTQRFEQVAGLISELDSAPRAEDVNIASITLENARALDVAESLESALPSALRVTITPISRSNTLLLTGSDEAIALVQEQIDKLDIEPAAAQQVFKRVKLEHVLAIDVRYTLQTLLRALPLGAGESEPEIDYSSTDNVISIFATPSQMTQIEEMIGQLDVPDGENRTTEFVRLEYADAEQTSEALKVFYGRFAAEAKTFSARNVSIVADKASNSLVISADDSEWPNIRNLLEKLDTEEYDTSRQLVVIPLRHADAASVARALNEGFRQQIQADVQRQRAREGQNQPRGGDGRDPRDDMRDIPTVIVDTEGVPSVSAEVQTNSLIISAGRKELERIQRVIEQLDVPEYVQLPEPVVIPIERGRASTIATAIREMFATQGDGGPRSARIFGDDLSNTLIVRAEAEDLLQIWNLARSLQEESEQGISPRILRIGNVPASRMRDTVETAFTPIAEQLGEPLVVSIDRTSNSLIVSASPGLFDQISDFVDALERSDEEPGDETGSTGALPGVRVVDVANNAPADIITMLEAMGVTSPTPEDRLGLVSEPVTLVEMVSKRAISVIGSSRDARAVEDLILLLDAQPMDVAQEMQIVPLKLASAADVVATLQEMLDPATNASGTGPALAVTEHVRRLNLVRGFGRAPISLDLRVPIRLIAAGESNSVIVASSADNVAVTADLIETLDTLPIGDAVVVRIFPLENASAGRVKTIVDELFSQGEALRRLPGTDRQGLPPTITGQALAGEIVVSLDERTNALVVAGREEAVALVEVLIQDLDSDTIGNWVEPAIIALEHADARTIADLLTRIVIDGATSSADALGIQGQIARLRVLAEGGDPSDPTARVEADLFVPLTSLIVEPDPDTNTLIVVGTPANIQIVREIVRSLDVELAAAGNAVRFFPLQHAAADRVAGVLSDVFSQREAAGALREEDQLVVSPDPRTNTLLVATSARSFDVIESLLETLDAPDATYTVGLHVLPVPGADVASLAPKLQQLMQDRIESTRRSGGLESPLDTFRVVADPANSLLILTCSQENLELVKELLEAIDTDASELAGEGAVEIFPLVNARAEEVADSINEVYVALENQRRGEGAVSVTAESRLNALIVRGTQADIDAVGAMLGRFDTSEILSEQDLRRFELASANAIEVVRLLESVLAGRPLSGAAGQGRATKLRFLRQSVADEIGDVVAEAEVDDFIREQVRLTADLRTNSVIVAAPSSIVDLIASILEDLDSSTAGSRDIETFTLKNADARAMAEVLRDLFNLRLQGENLVLVPTGTSDPNDESGLDAASVTAVPDERQELSITIDARTNTLLVSGTEEYLALVRQVVDDLDGIEANEREQLVFHLTNAKAKEIELTLQDYFQGEADRIRTLLGGELGISGSVARQLEQEVTVVGDEKSNKLLISASPRYISAVEQIVSELDAAPPQVMIEVLLAEVTLDDEDTWGVDASIGGDTGLGNDMYRAGTFAAGGALASALGTPNLSVSSVDFDLMVRALEVQGKLEVLSRPSITVKNNEEARIQVGENVGLPGDSTQSGGGNVTTGVNYQDVGIILIVTPTISNDGFVQLDINPEISALTSRTTQVSENVSAPVITRRSVDTIVSVMDGQTVVIGGLIQSTEENRDWRVPIIGDIPVIGLPFRSIKTSNVKTELLVILTPRVIFGGNTAVARYQLLTDREINKVTDPESIIQEIGPIDPDLESAPEPESDLGSPDLSGDPPIGASRVQVGTAEPPESAPDLDWSTAPRVAAIRPRKDEDDRE